MEGEDMDKVIRIHLKTDCKDREKLICYCLHRKGEQKLAIGWSSAYTDSKGNLRSFENYRQFYYAVKDRIKRVNHALNVFWFVKEGNLFWTRDLEGHYWICRAKGPAVPEYDKDLDIGAVVPVEAYEVGMTVPGQISASFNRPRGGTCQYIYDEIIVEYSKYMFNKVSGKNQYTWHKIKGSLFDNLPPFDLEELVISYLQIKEDYYVLSNSIAKGSTTVKIECEFRSRNPNNPRKAVVQVKGKEAGTLDALSFQDYVDKKYIVYLFAPTIENLNKIKNCIVITREKLQDFYDKYKKVLPESIKEMEDLFD